MLCQCKSSLDRSNLSFQISNVNSIKFSDMTRLDFYGKSEILHCFNAPVRGS